MATDATEQVWDTPTIQASTAQVIIHNKTRIAAPAALVFSTLRNTETWKDWCHFVPKVVITYQPPDEDLATATEIRELVRNTSIAGSFNSDLTDGLVGSGSLPRKDDTPPDMPPLKLRSRSDASAFSTARTNSEASQHPASPQSAQRSSSVAPSNGTGLSAAQKYAAAQASRRSSVQQGGDLPPVTNNNLVNDPFLSPQDAGYNAGSPARRRSSKRPSDVNGAVARAKEQSDMAALALYGEPSVRLQLDTKLTFFVRMNPKNLNDFKQTHIVVTEVSRPDDPVSEGSNLTALTRSKTHTLSRNNVYRIVWSMDSSKAGLSTMKSGSAFPKSLLHTERVSEIRPIVLGDGTEECEFTTWECQKGPLAKMVKKKYEGYLAAMFELWGKGLGQFCEAMGGKVDRRDFSMEVMQAAISEGGGDGFNEVKVFSTAGLG